MNLFRSIKGQRPTLESVQGIIKSIEVIIVFNRLGEIHVLIRTKTLLLQTTSHCQLQGFSEVSLARKGRGRTGRNLTFSRHFFDPDQPV